MSNAETGLSWDSPGNPPKSELQKLPTLPGIYKMVDSSGELLYIGKAKNLKNRVQNYFGKTVDSVKTQVLVSKITGIELIITKTEHEALILENQLIKTHQPRYNILLKDDKSYPYIKVTIKEPFPKLHVVRFKQKDGSLYFGPYPSMGTSKAVQRVLLELFPIRQCKQGISLHKKEPKCLLLDIGKCIGPCIKKETKPSYDALIVGLINILSGKDDTVIKEFRKEMKAYSDKKEYEKAALVRDKIEKLEQITSKQYVELAKEWEGQVWAYHEGESVCYALVQGFQKGRLLYQRGFYVSKKEADRTAHLRQSIIEVFNQHPQPKVIICEAEDKESIKEVIGENKKIKLESPQKGLKKELIEIAKKNAKVATFRVVKNESEEKRGGRERTLSLKEVLKLKQEPRLIFGFDISHLQGTDIVASAVGFSEGEKDTSKYRSFKIKTVKGKSNDPKSMYEVVFRRMQLAIREKEPLPDLILIDGGRAQLNFAARALIELELLEKVELVSLAKKEEEIYSLYEVNPLIVERTNPGLKLLQHIRDESHRFALTLQKKQRKNF